MAVVRTILTIAEVVASLFLILVVLLQSGKSAGIAGAIGGGMDTFLSKNKAKSWDAKLARWTKWVAIAFMIITLVLVLSSRASNSDHLRLRVKKGRSFGRPFYLHEQ